MGSCEGAVSSAAPRQVSTCETMSDGCKDFEHTGQSTKNDDACVSGSSGTAAADSGSTFPFMVFPSLDPSSPRAAADLAAAAAVASAPFAAPPFASSSSYLWRRSVTQFITHNRLRVLRDMSICAPP